MRGCGHNLREARKGLGAARQAPAAQPRRARVRHIVLRRIGFAGVRAAARAELGVLALLEPLLMSCSSALRSGERVVHAAFLDTLGHHDSHAGGVVVRAESAPIDTRASQR